MRVQIKYTFIFDPSGTWKTTQDLNKDLAKFFQSKGYLPTLVRTKPEPEISGLYVVTLEKQDEPDKPKKTKATPPGKQLDKLNKKLDKKK